MATSFFQFFTQHKLPSRSSFKRFLERPLSWYGVVLYALIGLILVTVYVLILVINHRYTVPIPARGGTLTEGVIGAPHVINPVLATTTTDRDLVSLVYSGLMKSLPDGTYAPDLAASYTLSDDGLTYTFTLRDSLKWSDGKPLTADDIAFTISKLSNPILHADTYWQGVSVSTPDHRTVVVTLAEPQPDLLARATIGILPQHIWSDVLDEAFDTAPANLHPVGSGPYKYASLKTANGAATHITLVRNAHAVTKPFIGTYVVDFFANQHDLLAALNDGAIDMTVAADATTASSVINDDYVFDKIESPNTVALFQLRNSTLFSGAIAQTIDQSIDKSAILATVEHGYGILPSEDLSNSPNDASIKSASFAAAVENDPALLLAANALADQLAPLGIAMTIKAFDPGTFQDVVQSQQYQFLVGDVREVPPGYSTLWTLYAPATPFIHTKSSHISIPEYLDSPDDRYQQLDDWHIRTNDVWTPFAKKYQHNQ